MDKKVKRLLWFVLGVVINSFGIALTTKAAMGTSPISSVPYVLSLWLPLSLGQFTFIVNMFFILAQIPLLRKEYQPVQLLQIGVNVVFSLFIDVSMSLLEGFTPSNPLISLLAVVAGCATLGLGISIEVAADMLLVPGEGVVKAINRRVGGRFGTVKVMFDLSCVIIAALVSVCSMGGIRGLGVGTLVSALIVGRFVNLYNKRLPLIPHVAGLKEE